MIEVEIKGLRNNNSVFLKEIPVRSTWIRKNWGLWSLFERKMVLNEQFLSGKYVKSRVLFAIENFNDYLPKLIKMDQNPRIELKFGNKWAFCHGIRGIPLFDQGMVHNHWNLLVVRDKISHNVKKVNVETISRVFDPSLRNFTSLKAGSRVSIDISIGVVFVESSSSFDYCFCSDFFLWMIIDLIIISCIVLRLVVTHIHSSSKDTVLLDNGWQLLRNELFRSTSYQYGISSIVSVSFQLFFVSFLYIFKLNCDLYDFNLVKNIILFSFLGGMCTEFLNKAVFNRDSSFIYSLYISIPTSILYVFYSLLCQISGIQVYIGVLSIVIGNMIVSNIGIYLSSFVAVPINDKYPQIPFKATEYPPYLNTIFIVVLSSFYLYIQIVDDFIEVVNIIANFQFISFCLFEAILFLLLIILSSTSISCMFTIWSIEKCDNKWMNTTVFANSGLLLILPYSVIKKSYQYIKYIEIESQFFFIFCLFLFVVLIIILTGGTNFLASAIVIKLYRSKSWLKNHNKY